MEKLIENNKAKLAEICRRYHVSKLEVFGSAATDDFDPSRSDVDFIVEFDSSASHNRFDNYFDLLKSLKDLFNRSVDIIEPGSLHNPYFIDDINKTKKVVYEAIVRLPSKCRKAIC